MLFPCVVTDFSVGTPYLSFPAYSDGNVKEESRVPVVRPVSPENGMILPEVIVPSKMENHLMASFCSFSAFVCPSDSETPS